MPAGRPPQPDEMNEARGDPGKRRRYDETPVGPVGIPEPPDYLSESARTVWDELLPELEAMGVVTKIDRMTLIVLVESFARYRDASDKIEDNGFTVVTESGEKYSPLNRVISENLSIALRILIEFGCTPAARARMRYKIDRKKPASKWDGKLKVTG